MAESPGPMINIPIMWFCLKAFSQQACAAWRGSSWAGSEINGSNTLTYYLGGHAVKEFEGEDGLLFTSGA